MDTAAYRFDEGNLYEGDAPLSCAGRAGASGSSGASRVAPNPYGRDAWARPQGAGSRSARSAGSKTAQGASPQRRPSRGSARAFAASAAVPGVVRAMLGGLARTGRAARGRRIGRRRWHLWSVLSVAALSIFVLVAIFQMANLYVEGLGLTGPGIASPTADTAPAAAGADEADDPASTPRDEWRGGHLPFLYQTDPQYRDAPYAGTTVREAGCGPTSLAMVYIALTGKTDKDPAAMAAFSEAGGYVEGGLTAWRLMTDGAAELGLSSHEVPADAGRLAAELAEGIPSSAACAPATSRTRDTFSWWPAWPTTASWSSTTPTAPPTAPAPGTFSACSPNVPTSGPSSGFNGGGTARFQGFRFWSKAPPSFWQEFRVVRLSRANERAISPF